MNSGVDNKAHFWGQVISREESSRNNWNEEYNTRWYNEFKGTKKSSEKRQSSAAHCTPYSDNGREVYIPPVRDPQAPRPRVRSARRKIMDWPHVSRETQTVNAPLYADYLHREAHVASSLPRHAEPPQRYTTTRGVSVAYNRAFKSPGFSKNVDSRSFEHDPTPKLAHHKHPNTDCMSTRNHPFPPGCPVHAYTPLPKWADRR
mmetsp:Transcript_179/g.458  ORF Transcript_179/g.458 Transcript_179/m.458 type:complete len:203 (+) Transcript_179:217-825(+)